MSSNITTTNVYYDGACPLCRREINLYRKLEKKHYTDNRIHWIDISRNQNKLDEEGIIYEDAMRLIHIKDSSGVHQVGLDGILTLWDQIPYYRKLSHLIRRFPKTHPFLARCYEYLAKYRMKLPGRTKS